MERELCGNRRQFPDSAPSAHDSAVFLELDFVKFSRNRHVRNLLRPKHGPGREDFGCQGVGSRQENREKKSNCKLVQFPHYPVIFHTPIASSIMRQAKSGTGNTSAAAISLSVVIDLGVKIIAARQLIVQISALRAGKHAESLEYPGHDIRHRDCTHKKLTCG